METDKQYKKIRLLNIEPRINNNKLSFSVGFRKFEGERDLSQAWPHKSGWYYHPQTLSKRKAFERLKAVMISDAEEKFNRAQDYLRKLQELELE